MSLTGPPPAGSARIVSPNRRRRGRPAPRVAEIIPERIGQGKRGCAPAPRTLTTRAARVHQRAAYLPSMISVTGPSLTNSTCIMAPNRPVATATPWARTASRNAS
jgi:hypothetical protein